MFETIILIIFTMFIIIYKLLYKSRIITVEGFDKTPYLVNDLPDSQNAANVLARIMMIMNKLINNILKEYDMKQKSNTETEEDNKYIKYVKIIKERLPYVKISESPLNSKFTSYSINKGEELVFCIRNKTTRKIHPLNELLYVSIHEIAHIGCPEIGHTELFRLINLYLLKKAVCYGLYIYVDYFEDNKDYCGMTLTSTILPNKIYCDLR
jgi:predicted metal-dependent hydrolase